MPTIITVCPENGGTLDSIVADLITSAAYYGGREIEIEEGGEEFSVTFPGNCPRRYFKYLKRKYDVSFERE